MPRRLPESLEQSEGILPEPQKLPEPRRLAGREVTGITGTIQADRNIGASHKYLSPELVFMDVIESRYSGIPSFQKEVNFKDGSLKLKYFLINYYWYSLKVVKYQ